MLAPAGELEELVTVKGPQGLLPIVSRVCIASELMATARPPRRQEERPIKGIGGMASSPDLDNLRPSDLGLL